MNVAAPSPVATELFLTGKSAELIQSLTKDIPLGRLGEPDYVDHAVSFLASPESGLTNRQVIKASRPLDVNLHTGLVAFRFEAEEGALRGQQ